jgi:hypothetical protein
MSPGLEASIRLENDRKEMVARIFQAMETEGPRFHLNSHSDARSLSRSSMQPPTAASASTSMRSRVPSATELSSIPFETTTMDEIYIGESTTDEDASTDSSESGDEATIEDEYGCPPNEWETITKYLYANRGPYQLALDTMGWLPEPAFHRYIRDHGGLDITPGNSGASSQRQTNEAFISIGGHSLVWAQ